MTIVGPPPVWSIDLETLGAGGVVVVVDTDTSLLSSFSQNPRKSLLLLVEVEYEGTVDVDVDIDVGDNSGVEFFIDKGDEVACRSLECVVAMLVTVLVPRPMWNPFTAHCGSNKEAVMKMEFLKLTRFDAFLSLLRACR